ncbi:MAG: UDP-glucose 4-epimerase GalE [Tissierellia bacterium]|nr:UDP-glucose 4-epimerase GalE [Tissierellia bacterium]
MKNILITGGAGYIGSHICLELLNSSYNVIVYDNLSNSSEESLKIVEELTNKKITFYKGDILQTDNLKAILKKEKIDAVIHCAALKAVGESVKQPLKYYHNNITGTLSMLKAMDDCNVKNIIFSSSATVYGDPASVPITEDFPKGESTNPYGWTKSMMEQIMTDLHTADKEWKVILLRYFNPIGAHKSGKIGEDPKGIPSNLLPYVSQVAIGKLPYLHVFGDDYNTHDGTGVRDYIHVVDLAKGHVLALDNLNKLDGVEIFNLATGHGYSVLDIIKAFEKVNEVKIPYKIEERREGDIDQSYANADKAKKILGWKAENGLEEMVKDSWRWQKNNPNGYKK